MLVQIGLVIRELLEGEMEMETLVVFTVWDAKAEGYLQPFFALNDAVGIRLFEGVIADPEHTFSVHAEDYSLWKTATFSQKTGEFEPLGAKVCLAFAHEIRAMFDAKADEQQLALAEVS